MGVMAASCASFRNNISKTSAIRLAFHADRIEFTAGAHPGHPGYGLVVLVPLLTNSPTSYINIKN